MGPISISADAKIGFRPAGSRVVCWTVSPPFNERMAADQGHETIVGRVKIASDKASIDGG